MKDLERKEAALNKFEVKLKVYHGGQAYVAQLAFRIRALLLIQLPDNAPAKPADDGSSTGAPANHAGDQEFLAPAFSLAVFRPVYNHLGSEPAGGSSHCLSNKP